VQTLKYADWTVFITLLLLGAGLWRLPSRKNRTVWLLRLGWLFLFLVSWSPFATLLMGLLEWQVPERPASNPGAQAIVVLAGGVLAVEPREPPQPMPAFSTQVRTMHAAWLYQHGWKLPVVVAGGPSGFGVTLADVMEDLLRREGLPADAIWKEGSSSSTYENARNVAAILMPKGIRSIVLVTEAYHMPRAVRLFRHAGFTVTASACAYRTREFQNRWDDWLLLAPKSMLMCEEAVHETLSFTWSWMSGKL
jgi:uncharacterized SAM-binding protein YcdF (DUF218 family)